jgi:uncharacterized RDD family membrane protein YckC
LTFCKHCGGEIAETDKVCSHCGKPTTDTVAGAESQRNLEDRYATLGERFLAVLIDTIILGVVTAIILIPLGIIALIGSQLGSPIGWIFGVPQLLWFVTWVLYFTYFESTSGQTIGKRAMSIKVVDESGGSVDMGRMLVRNILRIIDWLPFLYIIGFILFATSSKNQRLGDLVAKTIVIKE